MLNLKRLTFFAVLFLVILRLAIGWQMFYEGLWKYERVGTSQEWSAEGYLKNAQGPLRDHFRNMVDDPDDLDWLDYDKVSTRWDTWKTKFIDHYGLDDKQKSDFEELVEGPQEIPSGPRTAMKELPRDKLIGGALVRDKTIYTRQNSRGQYMLVVSGKQHLTPADYSRLTRDALKREERYREQAKTAATDAAKAAAAKQADLIHAFRRTLDDVYKRQTKLAFRERLQVLLKQDPNRVSLVREDQEPGSVDHKRQGKIDEYKTRLERYNETAADVKTGYQRDHLQQEWQRIRELNAELVGPVKKLEADLQTAARRILSEVQYDKDPVATSPPGRVARIDKATMWSLMVIGMLLIVGLFSRLSALAGGLLILSFYLAQPPWPGVPQPPGPEHSLIVNKNLLEVLALFMLVFIPTGKYFGMDAFFIGLFRGRRDDAKRTSSKKQTVKTATVTSTEKVPVAKPAATAPSPPPPLNPADTYAIKPDEKKR